MGRARSPHSQSHPQRSGSSVAPCQGWGQGQLGRQLGGDTLTCQVCVCSAPRPSPAPAASSGEHSQTGSGSEAQGPGQFPQLLPARAPVLMGTQAELWRPSVSPREVLGGGCRVPSLSKRPGDRWHEGVETALGLGVLSSRLGHAAKLLCDLEQGTSLSGFPQQERG